MILLSYFVCLCVQIWNFDFLKRKKMWEKGEVKRGKMEAWTKRRDATEEGGARRRANKKKRCQIDGGGKGKEKWWGSAYLPLPSPDDGEQGKNGFLLPHYRGCWPHHFPWRLEKGRGWGRKGGKKRFLTFGHFFFFINPMPFFCFPNFS